MEPNTQRLLHTFSALADLGQEIANTADFEEMLRSSFHLLLGSVAIRRGAVAQYDRQRDTLRIITARGWESASAFTVIACSTKLSTKLLRTCASTRVCGQSTKRRCGRSRRRLISRIVTRKAIRCASANTAKSSRAKWAGPMRKWKASRSPAIFTTSAN